MLTRVYQRGGVNGLARFITQLSQIPNANLYALRNNKKWTLLQEILLIKIRYGI